MNKITIVVPTSKHKLLLKLIKSHNIKRYVDLRDGRFHKFELIVTELITQELIESLKNELGIKSGKPLSEGYITVNSTNLIAPIVIEKGKTKELNELILSGAKKFIKLDHSYVLFTICAAMIASIGFQLDNLIILIGSMLVSPLMSPVMAVSYGMSCSKKSIVLNGLRNELVGVSLIILTSLLMSLLPNQSLVLENTLASSNLLLILLLSIIIGVVAANSFITGRFEALTGVAVGISLLPPLTGFVLLIIGGSFINAINFLFSFIFNILGMHLSALITFIVMNRSKKS